MLDTFPLEEHNIHTPSGSFQTVTAQEGSHDGAMYPCQAGATHKSSNRHDWDPVHSPGELGLQHKTNKRKEIMIDEKYAESVECGVIQKMMKMMKRNHHGLFFAINDQQDYYHNFIIIFDYNV